MTVASTVLTIARGLLNDPDPGAIYTDTKLIPLLDLSSRELQLMLFGIDSVELEEISALLTVPANTTKLNDVAGYPTDLLEPVRLAERASGSTDFFSPMQPTDWEPDLIPDNWIKYWVWRESELKINPSTSVQQVKLFYLKSLGIITSPGSTIPIPQSEVWLAYKTAETAARVIGENPSRATSLTPERLQAQNAIMGNQVKNGQISPARHRKRRRTWR